MRTRINRLYVIIWVAGFTVYFTAVLVLGRAVWA